MIALKDSLESDFVEEVRMLFSKAGRLSQAKNFEYRPEQQEMAVAIARALEEERHLVVEAGTGVGKSIAYLAPSILYAIAHKKKATKARKSVRKHKAAKRHATKTRQTHRHAVKKTKKA